MFYGDIQKTLYTSNRPEQYHDHENACVFMQKPKTRISCALIAQLINVFLFAEREYKLPKLEISSLSSSSVAVQPDECPSKKLQKHFFS